MFFFYQVIYSYKFPCKYCFSCICKLSLLLVYFDLEVFLLSLVISSLVHWLFRSMLFYTYLFMNVPNFFIIDSQFNSIVLGKQSLISVISKLLKVVWWSNVGSVP